MDTGIPNFKFIVKFPVKLSSYVQFEGYWTLVLLFSDHIYGAIDSSKVEIPSNNLTRATKRKLHSDVQRKTKELSKTISSTHTKKQTHESENVAYDNRSHDILLIPI